MECPISDPSHRGIDGHIAHDDVIKWKHLPRYWPFVRGIHRSPVNSPHKGQWHGALKFSLICAWIQGLVNNGEPGELRRHRAHYDAIVMVLDYTNRIGLIQKISWNMLTICALLCFVVFFYTLILPISSSITPLYDYSGVRLPRCQSKNHGWYITVTTYWVRLCLKSPASQLFTQPFIQAQIEENIKAPRLWPFWGEFTGHRHAENVFVW